MCRLLAVASRRPIPAAYLGAFGRLAAQGRVPPGATPGHRDGWGVVLYDEGRPAYLGREPHDASADPAYGELLEKLAALRPRGILLAHLRKASVGAPARENTQPFVHGPWAFAHNGTIRGEVPTRLKLQGTTDSEAYFKAIAERLEAGVPVAEAVEAVTAWIRGNREYSSLTFLLSDGSSLYGYREWTRAEEYYALNYARSGEALLLAQEPVVEAPWRPLGNRQLIRVAPDLTISIRQL